MRRVDFVVETAINPTTRIKQLSGMFDVPVREKLTHHWQGDLPLDARPWQIGLIVGPSGSGKSTLLRELFGAPPVLTWSAAAVIDDFSPAHSIQEIADTCSAVGFNTIPSWMKPYAVLSTGERFRVEVARVLLENTDRIVIDEFTSVVDRQVAQIGSHAIQKFVRKHPGWQLVAATCHYDVIDWLQPDWMLEPATMTFQWRSLQRRPALAIEIARVDKSAWQLFAPFHYLTAELHRAANCFVLFVNDVPAVFCGILHRPHTYNDDIKGISRVVTLPDYQGLGLAFVLTDTLGAAYKALGFRLHHYPAHPPYVRAVDRSPHWHMLKRPGKYAQMPSQSSPLRGKGQMGGRPCAVFEYVGPASDRDQARALIQPAVLAAHPQ